MALVLFAAFFVAPVLLKSALYFSRPAFDWWNADRSSAGLLPTATQSTPAVVRVFAAPTVRWRGIFAVHSWIVLKEAGKPYERYDVTAWGSPVSQNRFAPDGKWFGAEPQTILAVNGEAAAKLIPKMRRAIADYKFQHDGDYVAWPGPNSNTFVASVLAAIPEAEAALPSLAIGRDYPWDGRWFGFTASGTGVRATLRGYAGVTIGWFEGIEVNLLGIVAGLDIRRPALILPAFGRFGKPAATGSPNSTHAPLQNAMN